MDYSKIIGRAWEITKKYRWLWWLGLLALWAEGYSASPGDFFESKSPTTDQTNQSDFFQQFMPAAPVSGDQSAGIFNLFPKTHAESLDSVTKPLSSYADNMEKMLIFFGDHVWLSIGLIIAIAILWLLIAYISYSAKAGLILSVKSIEASNKEIGFKKAYHDGRKFTWRLIGQDLIVGLAAGIGLGIIVLLCCLPWLISQTNTSMMYSIFVGILLVIPVVLGLIYIGIIMSMSSRAIVIENMGVFGSIAHIQKIVGKNMSNTFVLWLIEVGISLALGIIIMLFIFFFVMIIILVGVIFALVSPVASAIAMSVVGVALLLALLFAAGMLNTFLSSYWTISYRALNYLASNKK